MSKQLGKQGLGSNSTGTVGTCCPSFVPELPILDPAQLFYIWFMTFETRHSASCKSNQSRSPYPISTTIVE